MQRHLGEGVGARLKDDEADADGARLLLEDEPLGELGALQGLAEALVGARDAADALRQLLDLAGLEDEALEEGVGDLALRRLAVGLVLKEDLRSGGGGGGGEGVWRRREERGR